MEAIINAVPPLCDSTPQTPHVTDHDDYDMDDDNDHHQDHHDDQAYSCASFPPSASFLRSVRALLFDFAVHERGWFLVFDFAKPLKSIHSGFARKYDPHVQD